MLTFGDYSGIASVQATIFTPGLSFHSPSIFKKLFQIEPDLFDGDPTVLPIPEDAPKEIPRITLQNNNKSLKLEVSPSRVNFFRTKISPDDDINIENFAELSSQFLNSYLGSVDAKCGRLAAVVRRFSLVENPGRVIAVHFCRKEFLEAPFDKPENFEIHAHKAYLLKGFDRVNSWVRIRSGIAQFAGQVPKSAIIVEQDINTLSKGIEEKSYNEEEITKFYKIVAEEFDIILKLYFQNK